MKFRFVRYLKKPSSSLLTLILTMAAVLLVSLSTYLTINIVAQYHSTPAVAEEVVDLEKTIETALPRQLIISSINVKVDIEFVGLTDDGAMYIDPSSSTVGWYMLGPRPGDKGSAVIAGHYGWDEDGRPAIFNDIQKLKKGDEISVIDQKEHAITFVVMEIREYNPDSDASEVFQSDDNGRHLNLITCNGTWENDKQSYSNRLVVFTDMKK